MAKIGELGRALALAAALSAAAGATAQTASLSQTYAETYRSAIKAGIDDARAKAIAGAKTYDAAIAAGRSVSFAAAYVQAMRSGVSALAEEQGRIADQAETEAALFLSVRPAEKRSLADEVDWELFRKNYVDARVEGRGESYAIGFGKAGQGWLWAGGQGMRVFADAYVGARSAGGDDAKATAYAAGYTDAMTARTASDGAQAAAYATRYAPFFETAYAQIQGSGKKGSEAIGFARYYAQTKVGGRSETYAQFYAARRSAREDWQSVSDAYAQYYAQAREEGDSDSEANTYAHAKERGENVATAHDEKEAARAAQMAAAAQRAKTAAERAAGVAASRQAKILADRVAAALRRKSSICEREGRATPVDCETGKIISTFKSNEMRFGRDYKGLKFHALGRLDHVGDESVEIDSQGLKISCDRELLGDTLPQVAPDAADWNPGNTIMVTGIIESVFARSGGTSAAPGDMLTLKDCRPQKMR